jgi:hypothetical protein
VIGSLGSDPKSAAGDDDAEVITENHARLAAAIVDHAEQVPGGPVPPASDFPKMPRKW